MKNKLVTGLLVAWMISVYAFHYGTYYGPRLVRFIQQWLAR